MPLTIGLISHRTLCPALYTSHTATQALGVGPSIGCGDCSTDVVGLGWSTLELFGAVGRVDLDPGR